MIFSSHIFFSMKIWFNILTLRLQHIFQQVSFQFCVIFEECIFGATVNRTMLNTKHHCIHLKESSEIKPAKRVEMIIIISICKLVLIKILKRS
jgi:hypothetical protein